MPFTFSDQFKEVTTRLSGNALDVTLSNTQNSFNEALLFTHRGLSGPTHYSFLTTGTVAKHFKSISFQVMSYWRISKRKNSNSRKSCYAPY